MVGNFVWNSSSLPGFKTNVNQSDNPSQQWAAEDANAVFQALYDIRNAFLTSSVNVMQFGAVADGVTDNGPALQRALNFASASLGSSYGSIVQIPKGVFCFSPVVVPNGVGIRGAGPSATTLLLTGTFSGSSAIKNLLQDGTQEFAFIEDISIDGNSGHGAVCGSVVDFTGLFVTSYIRNVVISNGSNLGLHIGASGSPGGAGPFVVENAWVLNNGTHNIMVEEMAGNAGAMMGISFNNVYSEHQGSNSSALYLKGLGNASQWTFRNLHFEQGSAATGRTCITLDGVPFVTIDNVQVLANISTVSEVVKITTSILNVGFEIGPIFNPNLVTPVIRDLKNGVTIGSPKFNVRRYVTPDEGVLGGPRFTPAAQTGSKSIVFQDQNGDDRAWFDESGSLSGSSAIGRCSIDITGDRPLALVSRDRQRAFGWQFSDASNFLLKYFTGNTNLLNFDNSGNGFVYQPMTFQFGILGQATRLSPPAFTGSVGQLVTVSDPIPGGFAAWIWTVSGSWKSWGSISP